MDKDTADRIRKLFSENEDFRKEFVTNTKLTLAKYGVELEDGTPVEFNQTNASGGAQPMKCVVVSATGTDGFLICDF